MNIRGQSMLRQFFLLLVFFFMFLAMLHPPGAIAKETTVEEMIGTLSKKSTTEPAAGAVRMRSIGGNKSSTAAGQLQLSVQFDLGSANISPTSRELLTKLGTAINSPALAGQRFRIEGHTDATGDAETNQRLSARRAQSVQAFLEGSSKVAKDRLSSVGKGSSEPIDAANPKAAVNRRVVVAVIENTTASQAPALPAVENAAAAATATVVIPNANVAGAGIVMQVRGEVTVIRTGGSVKLVEGDNIREGDTISTPVGASVLLQLSDDAKLLVRAGTTVRLTQIVNDGPVEKRSQLIELTLGALRYVTGALGKLQPQAVRFKTPTASVGIRGTDIDIVYTIATRSLQPAGTYVRVNTGAVDLNGSDGPVVALNMNEQATAAPEGPRLRGGGRGPAAKKLEQPVTLFQADELDSLLNTK
jgi:OmpA-OmpF porin, OOP family